MSATRKGQQVQALRIKKTKECNFMAIPVNTTIPTISGTAQVGQTLTASTGTWTNSPTVYVYQWASAGAPISGAAASSYIPVTSDIGNALAVYVTAANSSGHNKPTASAPTGAVINIIPTNSTVPTISGTAQVGQTLTATTGTWTNNPTSFTYQWNRAGTAISGATASSYVPVTADIGNTLAVSVTTANTGGSSPRVTSAPTGAVINIIPANSTVPTISGTAQVGQTLTATTGTWTNNPTSFTYQWNRAGAAISGATASSYVPVTADIRNTLTVSVTTANTGGSSPRVTSAPTGAVIKIIPANSTVPTISGTARVGQTLTASTGTWTNSPTSYAYQWNRAGTAISGATASAYVPVSADVADTLAVSVVATNTGGASAPATSMATSAVTGGGSIPTNTAVPTISGIVQLNNTLTASTGSWTNSPTSYTYQWNRAGTMISGATGSSHVAVGGDIGNTLTVSVVAVNSGGSSTPATSAASIPVPIGTASIKIMPLGDSVTYGTSSPIAVPGGYRLPLYQTLNEEGIINLTFVGSLNTNGSPWLPYPDQEGHGGFTISGAGVSGDKNNIKYGIDTLNWLSLNPDVIVLLIGINDLFAGRTTAQANTDYNALLNDILITLPSVKVICATLVQQGSTWVDTFDANLATLVAASGPRVSLADTHNVLTATDLSSDNTHPTQGGYNKMAPVLAAAVIANPLIISGTVQVGQTLTASGGSARYQWNNEGSPISGATSSTYTLQSSDLGAFISVSSGGAVSQLAGPVIGTTVFYVSSSLGSDSNAGTLAAPWQTLSKVNAQSFAPGTSVLFKRGDKWDRSAGPSVGGPLQPIASGTAGNPIVYDAYGTGANPIIDGSADASLTTDWTLTSTPNVWQSVQTFPPTGGVSGLPFYNANDIGNILWNFAALGGSAPAAVATAFFGKMTGGGVGGVWYNPGDGQTNLGTTQGNWNFNTGNFTVQVYSVGNPATEMPGLRLAMSGVGIWARAGNYSTFQNLTIQNTSGSAGILIWADGITVRDFVIQWIGGGNNGGASNADSRQGDGIQPANVYNSMMLERNFINQTYDGAIVPQSGGTPHNNLTIRNNVMYLTENAIGILNSPGSGTNVQNGLFIYNNTTYGVSSWSDGQRPNGVAQKESLNILYDSTVTVSNTDIRNNVFAGNAAVFNTDAAFLSSFTCNPAIPGPNSGVCTLQQMTGTTWDYNNWSRSDGAAPDMGITNGDGNFPMTTWFANHSFEAHGLIRVDPSFTKQSAGDLTMAAGSPLRNAGANLSSVGVVWDFNHKPRPASGPFTIGAFQ